MYGVKAGILVHTAFCQHTLLSVIEPQQYVSCRCYQRGHRNLVGCRLLTVLRKQSGAKYRLLLSPELAAPPYKQSCHTGFTPAVLHCTVAAARAMPREAFEGAPSQWHEAVLAELKHHVQTAGQEGSSVMLGIQTGATPPTSSLFHVFTLHCLLLRAATRLLLQNHRRMADAVPMGPAGMGSLYSLACWRCPLFLVDNTAMTMYTNNTPAFVNAGSINYQISN